MGFYRVDIAQPELLRLARYIKQRFPNEAPRIRFEYDNETIKMFFPNPYLAQELKGLIQKNFPHARVVCIIK